ncbi:hypothetical protein [Mucilaginibacter sp. R-33]|uniref:hypothetical protein n=1 Tax=Mucilaginibacter sp. R-33 TaxID=3416711 RepID=UPI003CEDF2C2
MGPLQISYVIGDKHCDMEAIETECAGHAGPCFLLKQDNDIIGTICKTVGGYIHVGDTGLGLDDISGTGEQIDAGLSSF